MLKAYGVEVPIYQTLQRLGPPSDEKENIGKWIVYLSSLFEFMNDESLWSD